MPAAAEIVGRDGEGMKIKGAIFDFDGTLFDSMFIWDTLGEDYLRSIGKEPGAFIGEKIKTMSLYQAACYFKDEYDIALSAEEIVRSINQRIEHFYIHEVQPKPGVISFLKELRQAGVSLCVATATDRYQIEAALKRCGMDELFLEVFTCGEVGHGKDEPVIYRKAMEFLNTDRSNTVIFEDAYHAVETAKNDGFHIVSVFDKSESRQEELRQMCDCYLPDFLHTDCFWKFASAT